MRLPYLGVLLPAALLVPVCVSQTPTLGLLDVFLVFESPSFSVELVKDSQTLFSIKTKSNSMPFDFIPGDVMWLGVRLIWMRSGRRLTRSQSRGWWSREATRTFVLRSGEGSNYNSSLNKPARRHVACSYGVDEDSCASGKETS